MITERHPAAQRSGKTLNVCSLPPVEVKGCAWRWNCLNGAEFAVVPEGEDDAVRAVCGSCLSDAIRALSPVPAIVF